jgi:acetyl-CoA synthetase
MGRRPLMLGRWRRQRTTAPADDVWSLPLEFNFARDVVERLARNPNNRAFTLVDENGIVTRHTFADVAREAARWAGLLRGHRLDPGAVVLVATDLTAAWPAVVVGALKAGLVAAPVAPTVDAAELSRRAVLTRAKALVAEPRTAPTVDAVQASLERPLMVLYLDEAAALLRDQPLTAATHPTVPRDPALLLPTSGTTGEPRLARHTNAHVWGQRLVGEHWLGAAEDDLVWCTAGPGTPAALWFGLLAPWSRGAEVILNPASFDADERLNLIEQLHITVLAQSPEEYRLLTELEGIEACDLRALRNAVSYGERPDPHATARWLGAFGVVVRNGYAQAETGLVLGERAGEVGSPATGTALAGHELVVLAGGEELEPGNEGELALVGRPPTLFAGYLGDEKPASLQGQRYLTGDRAMRDASGSFWLTGRNEDAISSAGSTVGALEIEAALLGHPAVADVAAVQASGGERRGAKAFVVAAARAEPGDDLAAVLLDHARHAGGVRAVPAAIEFVDSLPRSADWRVDRATLREQEDAQPAAPAAAAWPEPARLVVPPPRTLDEEPEPRQPAAEPEPEPEPTPVELHAVPERDGEAEAEPATEAEPEPEAQPEPEPAPPPAPAPISAPSQGSGLAARLAAYGRKPDSDDGADDNPR